MKKSIIIAIIISLAATTAKANINSLWQPLNTDKVPTKGERLLHPNKYKVFWCDNNYLKIFLFSLAEIPNDAGNILLPMPNGDFMNFRIWQTPVMHPDLAARYPNIKNFTAVSIDNPAITAKLNYTIAGFNAMIYNGANTFFIDPYSNINDGYYTCYYKKDYPNNTYGFGCAVNETDQTPPTEQELMSINNELPTLVYKTAGTNRKTLRLALTCTGEYAQAVGGTTPTKASVLAKMSTTLSRVNGILEKEVAVSLQLIANNDDLIYLDPATDPFTAAENIAIGNNTLTTNQNNTQSVIGTLNYDIGHVFCTGNNGIADLASACDEQISPHRVKARGATGNANPVGDPFDVDYVAHEIGHQLGANHTFNFNSSPGCNNRAEDTTAYEPGSGSTIMSYAGLCGGNDLQVFVDDYYHAKTLDEITTYISSTNPLTCGTITTSANTPPSVSSIQQTYEVPYKTPFELLAPQATDTDHDILTYCWEQYDLGDFGKSLSGTLYGPIFRSFRPTNDRLRVFPTMDSIRNNTLEYPGEKLPTVARQLNFRLTVRDVLNGEGTYHWSDNTTKLNVTDQAGPFLVTSQNPSDTYWQVGKQYTITWDVANTTNAPVSCNNVDIFLSLDDGVTWPITLAANTPNDGSETITVPSNALASKARLKVKGVGNVFFDINNAGFVINLWPQSVNELETTENIKLYPVPANDKIQIELADTNIYHAALYNTVGQTVWQNIVVQNTTINVKHLAAGIYHLVLHQKETGNKLVKKVVVQ